jgi:16S rRNA processing protein RimM
MLKMNIKKDKLILVGVIKSASGIKGDVLIQSFTDPIENIFKIPVIDQNNQAITLKFVRPNSNGLVARIDGCNNRNEAETYQKKSLYCLRQNLPSIEDEDVFYAEDLVGMSVLDLSHVEIGQVTNVVNYGAGDIIEIKFNDSKNSELYPFTKEFFPEISDEYIVLNLTNYSKSS